MAQTSTACSDLHHHRLYSRGRIADHYARHDGLFASERAILDRVASRCAGKPILDIGVGGGRTTPYLLQLSEDYLGLDYSTEMVERCRRRFPDARFEHADARRLERYPAGHYALIMFSFNGIDTVPHADRLLILSQLRRLLAKDGRLVFSSHNRQFHPTSPFDPRSLPTWNPLLFARRLAAYGAGIARFMSLRHHAYEKLDHAMRIDGAFNYSLIHYYIGAQEQRRQLRSAGFETLAVVNADGDEVAEGAHDASPWLYYLAARSEQRLQLVA